MNHIAIVSSSIRTGRKSHRVALFFRSFLEENQLASSEILDLAAYNFPLFEERLRYLASQPAGAIEFAERIKSAQGIIIITPEYNGGYPASLKNVIDLLADEWKHKPVGIVAVSDGPFGGTQVIGQLQFVLWKMGAYTIPARLQVANVAEQYDEMGIPSDKLSANKRASSFIGELLDCVALNSMKRG
ncbi:MAG: NAD(P)H-dependent oxidoreductase [Bacteroidales bacterium]|nr:NAD(P)H-dependent oxidoreductase [Bacteroidales bacterium]